MQPGTQTYDGESSGISRGSHFRNSGYCNAGSARILLGDGSGEIELTGGCSKAPGQAPVHAPLRHVHGPALLAVSACLRGHQDPLEHVVRPEHPTGERERDTCLAHWQQRRGSH